MHFMQIWHFIFATEITEKYSLIATDLPMIRKNCLIYQSLTGNGTVPYNYFDISNLLSVLVCDRKDFQTWAIAPVMTESSNSSNWVLLGETSKFIKMV